MILIYIQMSLNIDMETAIKTIQARLQEEWIDVQYPQWLATILDSELYYTVAMIVACADAFGIGLVIGWISGHTGR
jgi:hypothetical protein